MTPSDWPRAFGEPKLTGRIRAHAEDFQVYELLGFEPDGSGEHLWLEIEKIGLTTAEAQQQLARAFRLSPRDVHYAGLKDRQALTTQWFSLCVGVKRSPDELPPLPQGLRVVRAVKNSRKLRRGSHRGNRFVLTVRELKGDGSDLEARLSRIAVEGVPNYFGEQRFGHGGGNIAQVQSWWRGETAPPSRRLRSILLSAVRGFLFNAVLAERVRDCSWNQLLDGESLNLDGTSRQFRSDAATAEERAQRLRELDIHPTGPLWGRGDTEVSDAVAQLEAAVLARYSELCDGLLREGLEHARRPLRVAVRNLHYQLDADVLRLEFELSRGAYATAVLREFVSVDGVRDDSEEGGE